MKLWEKHEAELKRLKEELGPHQEIIYKLEEKIKQLNMKLAYDRNVCSHDNKSEPITEIIDDIIMKDNWYCLDCGKSFTGSWD